MQPSQTDQPLVTYLLMTYRHERFIREALQSALAQDYPHMEILVSDDASPDGTFAEIERCLEGYDGPHRVIVNRNESTMGLAPHINKLAAMAQGEMFVAAGGDDVASPDRVTALVKALSGPNIHAVHSNADLVDESGNFLARLFPQPLQPLGSNWMQMAELGFTRVSGSTVGMRRTIYDRFGPLPEHVPAEDQVIAFRAALLGGFDYIDRSLIRYRSHETNLSHWSQAIRAESVDQMLDVARRQLRKSTAEKRAMLKDLQAFASDCTDTNSKAAFAEGERKLQALLDTDQFRLDMLAAERPKLAARMTRMLPLAGREGLSLRKRAELCGFAISPKLFFQLKQRVRKTSLQNRMGVDS